MDGHELSESPVTDRRDSLTELATSIADRTLLERRLWVIAVLALVADVLLTYLGLQHGFTEGNPVARWAIGLAGIGALALVKLAALAIAVLVRYQYPRYGLVIPLGLAIPWVTAVALNTVTLT